MERSVDEQVSNQSESGLRRDGPMVTHLVGGSVRIRHLADIPQLAVSSIAKIPDKPTS
jgi:hypothetical protein